MALTSYAIGKAAVRMVDTAISASSTNSSTSFAVGEYSCGSIQVIWAAMSATATFEIQVSNDGSNYDTLEDSSFTTSGASGSTTLNLENVYWAFMKVVVTETDAAGTLQAIVVAKGKGR